MPLKITLSPKQQKALESTADLVVFGGGNGGGKTFTLQMLPLLPEYRSTDGCQSVIFAETDRKLEMAGGLVDKSKSYYAQAHPAGLGGFRATPKKRWTFPTVKNGASTVDLSYVGEPGQWDGLEAAVICIDQIEQVTEKQAWSVFGRNRSPTGVRCRKFATANPPETDLAGGPGRDHWLTKLLYRGGWIGDDGFPVKEADGKVRFFTRDAATGEFIFADTAAELTPYLPVDEQTGDAIEPKTMTFISALVGDHPLESFRKAYTQELASLPIAEQERRLRGNWFVSEDAGKYFQTAMFPIVEFVRDVRWRPRRIVRSWDNAWSTSEKADRTPGVLLSLWDDKNFTVLDMVEIRGTYAHVERCVELTAQADRAWTRANGLPDVEIRLPRDAGAAGGLQSGIAKRLGAKGYTVKLTADKGDKFTRSKGYQACCERRQVRLCNLHISALVAAQMGDDFDQYDRDGNLIRIVGLVPANILTLKGWHDVFLGEHINFGRDTHRKRSIKKDCVDAAVGGYELLVEVEDLSWSATDVGQGDNLQKLAGQVEESFVVFETGIA